MGNDVFAASLRENVLLPAPGHPITITFLRLVGAVNSISFVVLKHRGDRVADCIDLLNRDTCQSLTSLFPRCLFLYCIGESPVCFLNMRHRYDGSS